MDLKKWAWIVVGIAVAAVIGHLAVKAYERYFGDGNGTGRDGGQGADKRRGSGVGAMPG